MVVMGAAFIAVSDRWLLYTGHFVQLGPGVVAVTKKKEVAVFNIQ